MALDPTLTYMSGLDLSLTIQLSYLTSNFNLLSNCSQITLCILIGDIFKCEKSKSVLYAWLFCRITNDDGTAIDFKKILSWFMPRYVTLIGRCRLIPNHHVHEGKNCVPNVPYFVTSRDGLTQTDLASFCRSLPDHVLPRNALSCLWCPKGVKNNSLACNRHI